jgi:hypothetical protein
MKYLNISFIQTKYVIQTKYFIQTKYVIQTKKHQKEQKLIVMFQILRFGFKSRFKD